MGSVYRDSVHNFRGSPSHSVRDVLGSSRTPAIARESFRRTHGESRSCCSSKSKTRLRTRYTDALTNGLSLPEATISLTFDDGPGETDGEGSGPRTPELAQFLADQGIAATFCGGDLCVSRRISVIRHTARGLIL